MVAFYYRGFTPAELKERIRWMIDNVGPLVTPIDANVVTTKFEGDGWTFDWAPDFNGRVWLARITDEQKALLTALTWGTN